MNFLETPRVLMPKERLFSTSKSTDAITNFGFFFINLLQELTRLTLPD
jgi:hypothetical protein